MCKYFSFKYVGPFFFLKMLNHQLALKVSLLMNIQYIDEVMVFVKDFGEPFYLMHLLPLGSYQLWDTFKTTLQTLEQKPAEQFYSTLLCLFSSICKAAEWLQCVVVITSQAHFIQIIFTSQQKER